MIRLIRHLLSNSIFDVGRSMFDVHFIQSLPGKNNLALMVDEGPGLGEGRGASSYLKIFPYF